MTDVSLEFLARQLAAARSERAHMLTMITDVRGSIDVLTAMAIRHENFTRHVSSAYP